VDRKRGRGGGERERERERERIRDDELVGRKEDRRKENRAEHLIAITDYKSDYRPADIYLHSTHKP